MIVSLVEVAKVVAVMIIVAIGICIMFLVMSFMQQSCAVTLLLHFFVMMLIFVVMMSFVQPPMTILIFLLLLVVRMMQKRSHGLQTFPQRKDIFHRIPLLHNPNIRVIQPMYPPSKQHNAPSSNVQSNHMHLAHSYCGKQRRMLAHGKKQEGKRRSAQFAKVVGELFVIDSSAFRGKVGKMSGDLMIEIGEARYDENHEGEEVEIVTIVVLYSSVD